MSTAQIIYLVVVLIVTNTVAYHWINNDTMPNPFVNFLSFIVGSIAIPLDIVLIVMSITHLHNYIWKVLA